MKRYALALLALLSACDDGTIITHTDRLVAISMRDLVVMTSGGGIPTEIHGTPFAGATPADLAGALRPPARASQATRWRAVEPGGRDHGTRMVLHFNPASPPNSARDCRLTAPAETGPPQETGFRVTLTFCKGEIWQATGYLQARKTEAGDWEEYTRVMRVLLAAIFIEEPDR
ncbi:MAG: hypothetical protein AAF908_04030 [Pseudomonadota bacterium]